MSNAIDEIGKERFASEGIAHVMRMLEQGLGQAEEMVITGDDPQ